MLIVLKAEQIGLFEKLVPIAGSTTREGVVRKPTFGIRRVRPQEPAKPKPVAKPEPAPEKRAKKEEPDLFSRPAAAAPEKKEPKRKIPERPKNPHNGKPVTAEPLQSELALIEQLGKDGDKESLKEAIEAHENPPRPGMIGNSSASPVAAKYARDVLAAIDFNEPFNPADVPAWGVPAGTTESKRREINDKCIGILRNHQEFTAQVRRQLSQYSGNGGCGDSLNEFYTDPKVAAAAWYVLRNAGLPEGAEILEPSCATGVFLATKPAGVHAVGVEIDPVSSEIAAILHPSDEIQSESLEDFAIRDTRQFDAVIGNAPFGLRGALIKEDKPNLPNAEGYFLDTAIDKTKPGGMVAMIVPTGVLDGKNNRALRERLLRKADFVGAIRMPNTAFKHSHTQVVTDLVFFKKRPEDVAQALMVVPRDVLQKLGVWDDEYLSGSYFYGRGAKNILGTMTEGWRAKAGMGNDITVEGSMDGVPEAIAAFKPETPGYRDFSLVDILNAVGGDEKMQAKVKAASLRRPYDHAERGDTKVVDGVTYILEGNPLRWHRLDEVMQSQGITSAQELAPLIELAMQGKEVPDLAARVKAYVEQYGVPSKNPNLMIAAQSDKQLFRLIGAVKPDGTLSDTVLGVKPRELESTFDAAAQHLAVKFGTFTPEQVAASWSGGDAEQALDHLYASQNFAMNPDGTWTTMDTYLTGNLWPKFDLITAALAGTELKPEDRAKLEKQKSALEAAIDPRGLDDVDFTLASGFIPLNIVAAFFNERRAEKIANGDSWRADRPPLTLKFEKGIFLVNGGDFNSDLLDKYLNRRGVKQEDWPKVNKWNEEFHAWLCGSKYRDEVENLYNRKFRGWRNKVHSQEPIEIPGLSDDRKLNGYQYEGVRWALDAQKGIIAADVGLGKTPRGLIIVRLAKASGIAKRPIISVPKSVLANWLAEAQAWFPGCSVMTIGSTFSRDASGKLVGKDDSAAERNRKWHDITQNDYDFIIVSRESLNDVDLDPAIKAQYAAEDFWAQRKASLNAEKEEALQRRADHGDWEARTKLEKKMEEQHAQSVAKRDFQRRTDAIYFNELGVDMLMVDEAHAYKNLFEARDRFGQSPLFLGGSGLSKRALDMDFKAKWVRSQQGGNNVYLLTATPTKNSPLEVYSMLHHVAPEAFEKIGIRNSEEFLDRFCEFREENVLGIDGGIYRRLVTVGFKNMDELRDIMRQYIDRKTAEDVGLVLPKRDERMHLVDMTPQQQAVYEQLREEAREAAGKRDAKGEEHIFSVIRRMMNAAMDLEMYDGEKYKGAISPKYDAAVTEIVNGAKDGGQVVFAEDLAVHDKLRDALIKGGIPAEQIAIINAQVAPSAAKRQNICDDFNAGKIKVVIGNTPTMGEGVNLQKGTTDIHHMDLPWTPAAIQQRNGRGLRQGNLKEAVRIHTYLAKGSFDGYYYQTVSAKKDWQDMLWNGGDRIENLERGKPSRDEMMIMLATNPDEARARFESDKTAALQRYEAEQRENAAAEFVKLQKKKQSYAALKNKDTISAKKLAVQIDRTRESLQNNPHFTAKHALDATTPVIVHPHTGAALERGVGFEIPEGHDAAGKWVIKVVHPGDSESPVIARPYGDTGNSIPFELATLAHAKTFHYNEEEEKKEFERKAAAEAENEVDEAATMEEVSRLPESVVEKHYDSLQARLKEGLKAYRWSANKLPLVPKGGGAAVIANGYEAKEMLDTHDFMLPSEANKKAAIAAFIADERAKDFAVESTPDYGRRGKRGRNETPRLKAKYPGEYGASSNRWLDAGRAVFGSTFEKEAESQFEAAQNAAARHAKSLPEAISAVVPTVEVGYDGVPRWSKKGLAILWAHAKREGKLDAPLASVIPQRGGTGWASTQPKYPAQMFSGSFHEKSYSYYGGSWSYNTRIKQGEKMTVREALSMLSHSAGHHDLSAAMLASSNDPQEAVRTLLSMPPTPKVLSAIAHLAAKHPEIARARVGSIYENMKHENADRAAMTVKEYAESDATDEEDGNDNESDERLAA